MHPLLSASSLAAALFAAFTISASAQVEPPHPIMSIPGTGSGASGILTTYTEPQFLRFVPEWGPRDDLFTRAVVAGDTSWSWSASSPDEVISRPSNTVFPNSTYPIQYEAVSVLSGKTINVPFYLRAGSSTAKSMVFGYISYRKRSQLRSFLDQLAPAYVRSGTSPETRNDAYARRIAIALDAWANYVPDYYLTAKNSPSFINGSPSFRLTSDIQRASDHNGMAHEWHESELRAFDAIYDSRALSELSLERGYDVRAHIRNNLFCNIGDYFKDRVPINVAIATNLSGPFSILAKTARVVNRPDYILFMGDYLDATIRRKILRDGVLPEGIGYSVGYLNENIDSASSTRDYFLSRPADTPELEDVFLAASSYVPILQGGIANWRSVALPDGTSSSFGDTNFNTIMTARNAGSTGLLPAYGHLSFGTGSGSSAVQLNQNFSDDSNHMRADVTGFTLWANGAELLGNIRYYNSLAGRNFTEQLLSHNAVTIDRANLNRDGWNVGNSGHRFTHGKLLIHEPGLNGLYVSEIDGQGAYTSKASRYQRIMLLNTVDPARPYVVDVFRVTGGTTHDYLLHGAIRFDQTGEASFPLTPMAGTYPLLEGSETWVEPTSSGSSFPYYGMFRNQNQGISPNRFQITYRDTDTTKRRDLRLWMTGESGSMVYLGQTPNPGRTNTTPSTFYTHWRPSVIVRHRVSSGPLESLYASVVEPMAGGVNSIRAVDRVPLSGGGKEAIALRVWFVDGRHDTYLINLHNPRAAGAATGTETIATEDGQYVLTGRIGAYVSRPAAESRVWLIGATQFQHGAATTTSPAARHTGNVLGVTRRADGAANDAFIVDAPLLPGTALRGRQLSLTFGDYAVVNSTAIQRGLTEMFAIDRVELVGSETHVVLTADPKLKITGSTTRELVAPERTFTGTNRFEILLSTTAPAAATPAPTAPENDGPPAPPPPPPPPPSNSGKISIPASAVSASSSHASFPPPNTVDGNTSTRWAGNGDGVWIRFDLGSVRTVTFVKAAWLQGNTRTYTFDIQTSLDGTTWTTQLDRKTNTATAALETHDFPDVSARYVRLVGHMNTVDSWTNLTEFEVYTLATSAPVITPESGHYPDAQTVSLTSTTADATFRYTLDGSTPTTTNGLVYTGPFAVGYSTTVKAFAASEGAADSSVVSATYAIGPLPPAKLAIAGVTAMGSHSSFPPTNSIDGNLSTRWAASGDGVWARYDLGETKTVNFAKIAFHVTTAQTYPFDLLISEDGTTWTTIFAGRVSAPVTGLQTFNFPPATGRYVRIVGHRSSVDNYINVTELELWGTLPIETAAAPAFDPAAGTYNTEQFVTLSTATTESVIRYTLDGSEPSRTNGSTYTTPIFVDLGTTQIKAFAYTTSTFDSPVSTASYTIVDTTPPALFLPGDITTEATGPDGAAVDFTFSAEDDFAGIVPATASPPSGSTFPVGETIVNVTAVDDFDNRADGSFKVTVQDTTPPALTLPANQTLEAWSPAGAAATFAATAQDLVSGELAVSYSHNPGTVFPLGTTIVTATATDAAGNTVSGSFTITVVDTTAPRIEVLGASQTELWPANHQMVPLTMTARVKDIADPAPRFRIVAISSNEPVDGTGDGSTSPDWVITGDHAFQLRAERAGGGGGRIYTITVEAHDASGNRSTRSTEVRVAHDQGKK